MHFVICRNWKNCFEDEDKLYLDLNLNEVYKIITQTAYYLQKLKLKLFLPDELVNIVIPRLQLMLG